MSRHQNESQINNREHLKFGKIMVSGNKVKLNVTHDTFMFTFNVQNDDSTVQLTNFFFPSET